ncbi:hypothetical protein O181_043514 [Austropuccinia psidii MF-1]|uniref:Uncharacterized protein n=1 Tax=Austropuccinia psidii MF-1 TaxID=1389203 RepID=A0A9Q3HIH8_9BASI|nr:hypothetical protein [Austropuccinia psidii MF-1]
MMVSNRNTPVEACMESEKFILSNKILKELLQWRIASRELNQELHWKELVEIIQKISIKRKGSQDHIQTSYYLSHRRAMEPERKYSDFVSLKRSGQPIQLLSGFTPLRLQQINEQE